MSSASSGAPPLGRHADAIEVEPIASLLTATQLKSSTELLCSSAHKDADVSEPSRRAMAPIFDIQAVETRLMFKREGRSRSCSVL